MPVSAMLIPTTPPILDVKGEKEIARIKVGKAPKRLLVIEVPQDQLTEK